MSPEETIRAAITRLEQQRDAAMLGPWIRATWTHWGKPAAAVTGQGEDDDEVGYPLNDADADLIVTLHRTIDAQLRILREAEYQLGKDAGFAAREYNLFLPLARAILGEDQ